MEQVFVIAFGLRQNFGLSSLKRILRFFMTPVLAFMELDMSQRFVF